MKMIFYAGENTLLMPLQLVCGRRQDPESVDLAPSLGRKHS